MNNRKEIGEAPFKELQEIIRMAGYKVISIGAAHSDRILMTGVINLEIAPAEWIDQTDFVRFPQISPDFLANCREYAVQSHRQEKGNG
jgi:hypothetical protein